VPELSVLIFSGGVALNLTLPNIRSSETWARGHFCHGVAHSDEVGTRFTPSPCFVSLTFCQEKVTAL
jgi:hypothetical protein